MAFQLDASGQASFLRRSRRGAIQLLFLVIAAANSLAGSARGAIETASPPVTKELREQAIAELQDALVEQQDFIKIHAAEALIALGHDGNVWEIFQQELKNHGDKAHYRTGVWRVLAQATPHESERTAYIGRLCDTYVDVDALDRVHALEALAKLNYLIPEQNRSQFIQSPRPESPEAEPCLLWLLAVSGGDEEVRSLAALLDSPEPRIRGLTAYALRHLARKLPADVLAKLERVADAEPEPDARAYLLSSAYVAAPDSETAQRLKTLLFSVTTGNSFDGDPFKREVAAALAIRGSNDDLALLVELLRDPSVDVRISAAHAILRIERRRPVAFRTLDWIVLIGYGVGMMAIGWYYSRAKSVEEYLLGGRNMKPWAVGISLFATLMSTLSYLASPGEMIRHGPLVFASVLSFPLVYVVVGRFIIPFIMKLRVTSAYEILEQRLGLSVRMLGSTLFLLIRLMWMALIVYATSAEMLIPLLQLDDSATPWISAIMAIVTVIYTSMGGLKAVVVTDVVQTFIMFGGAILSLVLISNHLGGVAAWWPTSWAPNWDKPSFFFAPQSRVSIGMAILSQFTWYVCTVGSDQMAIQRYLATPDAKSARRMFGIALLCNALVVFLLAALGLALLAFFRSNPAMLPDGKTVSTGADQLLTQYIAYSLPAGISGLVVAGILSAAMDSLSSGINSSCSVITVDWIDRFRRRQVHGEDHVREAKLISWAVGLAVVLMSLYAGAVEGNLFEKCYTLVNLFVAPLFVLFFLAMFISWATAFGAWIGTFSGLGIGIAITYGSELDWSWFAGWSFLWIMPASLAVGVLVGCAASFLPIGPAARPMLETR
ncbi:MAG: Na+:solute symporter [Pirellulales bacterium]|nr:Na+:solute symporter [Pirellulales bacterium]